MGKNQSASNLTNIIQYNNGNIAFVSGSTTLMQISSSGAITTTGVISGSNALSASYAATASFVNTAQTASFVTLAQTASFVANAQSASNAVTAQTASFANAFTVAGTLTAQTLVVQTITSSVDYVTGSTRFGSSLSNTHVFSGSVTMNPNGLFVSSSGNVGIGTTSPSAKLHVQGTSYFFDQSIFGDKLGIGTSSPSYVLDVSGSGIRLKNSGGSADFLLDRASTSAGSTFQYLTAGTLKWYTGLRGLANDNFYIFNNATSTNTLILDESSNAATFASSVNIDGERLTIGGTTNNAIINNIASVRINIDCDNNNAGESFMIGHNQTGIDNNNVLFKVQDDGKVGIGTNSPSTLLHLNATTTQLTLQNTDGGTNAERAGLFMTGGDTFKLISLNDNNTTRTDNILVANVLDGKVGIGASTPSAQGLTIYQGGSDRRIMLELNRPNSPGLQSAIQFTVGNSIMVGQIQHEYAGSNLNHMSFSLRSPGGGDFVSMWLQNSGYVGIGNSNPATKLNVNNTVVGALLPYINGTGLSYNSEGISVAGSNTNNTNIGNGLTLFNNVASVGAYSPVIAFSSMTSGGAYNATYAFISGVYQGAGGDANWSKGDMIFGTGNSYGATMRLKLTQDGALLPGADNSYGFGGSGIRWAAIWAANGTIQTSDEREKKDIINADLGLDFINKLRPVSYKWKVGQNEVVSEFDGMDEDGKEKYKTVIKPREGKRTHYGLIAQEVEALLDGKDFGGFIHDENTDTKGLRYDQFIAPLIKAIQELKAENDTLKEILQRNNIQ